MSHAFPAPTYRSADQSALSASTAASSETRGAALEFLHRLATEVSKGSVDLPCFPEVVFRIRKALADPNTTPEKTVTLIGAEPRLAARLLQTANSAAFNTSGRPLTDLRSAITRLGQQLVQSATMAYAVHQLKHAESLRSIAKPLSELWNECISVAAVCQAVARRTKVSPDEAFLTGLLHGIGRLYIMVREVGNTGTLGTDRSFLDLVADWHPSIGKAVLENWRFAEEMCAAVGDQNDHERRWVHDGELTDILIVSVVLAAALRAPPPRTVAITGVSAFHNIGLTEHDCAGLLNHAESQLGSLHEALGC
jgi:HD-like signal output (HDOD) protein